MEFDGGNGDCIDGDAGDGRLVTAIMEKLVTAIMENGGRDEVVVTSDRANLICKPPTRPSTKIYIILAIVKILIGIICS